MKKPIFYTYLLSSLPMLQLWGRAPFSFDVFMDKCRASISEDDFHALSMIPKALENKEAHRVPIVNKWLEFETMLRNELVRLRAARRHIDSAMYIRELSFFDPAIPHIALSVQKASSILESEKILDQARWQRFDDLERGHFLDRDALIIYAFRLLILLKWDRIQHTDSAKALEDALAQAQ